jgi:hypothetical protein
MSGLSTQNMEANVLTEQQIKDGWIAYSGGGRPVGSGVPVRFMTRAGVIYKLKHLADSLDWSHTGSASDIIAYRPATPIKDERHG